MENKTKKGISGTIEGMCTRIIIDNCSNAKYPVHGHYFVVT